MVGVLSAMLGPSLVTFSAVTHRQPRDLGLLFTADSFGSVCGSLLAGRLLTRFSPHLQAAGGLSGIAAAVLVIPLLSAPAALLPAWWFLGMSKTFLIVTVNTLLICVRSGQVGPYMNVADFFLGVGSLLMPVAIAQSILWTGGLGWAYSAVGGSALLLMARIGRLASPQMTPAREVKEGSRRHPLVGPISLLLFIYVGAEISFSGWVPSFALEHGVTRSAATAAYFTSIFWIAVTVGRLLWLPFTKRVPPQRLLLISGVSCVVTLGLIWIQPASLQLLVAGTVVFGLSMSSIFPSAFTWLARAGPVTGTVSAWCLCTASLGAMFFPWWIGRFVIFSH